MTELHEGKEVSRLSLLCRSTRLRCGSTLSFDDKLFASSPLWSWDPDTHMEMVSSLRGTFLLILTQRYVYWFERERERETERERNTDVRHKHQSVASPSPVSWPRIGPATEVCALTGNWTHNLLVYGMTLQPTEPPGQGTGGFSMPCSIRYCIKTSVSFKMVFSALNDCI